MRPTPTDQTTGSLFTRSTVVSRTPALVAAREADPYDLSQAVASARTVLSATEDTVTLTVTERRVARHYSDPADAAHTEPSTGVRITKQTATSSFHRTPQDLIAYRWHDQRLTGLDAQPIDELLFDHPKAPLVESVARRLAHGHLSHGAHAAAYRCGDAPLHCRRLAEEVIEHLGIVPELYDRLPLFDPDNPDAWEPRTPAELTGLPVAALSPWIDATDAAAVARALVGSENYRKPLARLVTIHQPMTLAYYAGLVPVVPVDHVIEALRELEPRAAIASYLPAGSYSRMGAVTGALPAALLSRLLRTLSPVDMVIAMRETTALSDTELERLVGMIETTGQRKIRNRQDLTRLIVTARDDGGKPWGRAQISNAVCDLHSIEELCAQAGLEPLGWAGWCDEDLRRTRRAQAVEIITERQRRQAIADAELERQRQRAIFEQTHAEQLAWHDEMFGRWHLAQVTDDLTMVIAQRHAQLKSWASQLHNCIHGYSSKLDIEILAALVETKTLRGFSDDDIDAATPVVNLEVNQAHGLIQMFADQRKGMGSSGVAQVLGQRRGQEILDGLVALGVPVGTSFTGDKLLTLPDPKADGDPDE